MIQDNPLMSFISSGDYELTVRQQPREALVTQAGKEKSECMIMRRNARSLPGDLADKTCFPDRKPIDPPPIVQLKVPDVKDPIRYVGPVSLVSCRR